MDRHYSAYVDWSEEDEEFVALCPEFPGASGTGATPADAIAELHDAIDALLETYHDQGLAIPAPRLHEEFSGQVRLRLPKELHRELVTAAEKQGVSLNTLFVSYLAQGLGRARNDERLFERVAAIESMLQHQILSIPVSTSSHTSPESLFPAEPNPRTGFGFAVLAD